MADYGEAPYRESSLKAALRLLAAGARGAGAATDDPFSSFGNAYQNEQRTSDAARRAAQAYAMKQEEMRMKQEDDAIRQRFLEAQATAMERPPKPEKPDKPDPWDLPPDAQARRLRWIEAETKAKAAGRPAKPGAKGASTPKPPKLPDRVSKRIELINMADLTNPEHLKRLQAIIANPGTPQEKHAAELKIRQFMEANSR